MMVGCVEGILGIRPDLDGIRLSPSIPKAWKHLTIEKTFRQKHLYIQIDNPHGRESGCERLTLNGQTLPDNYIPASLLEETNQIQILL